METLSKPVNDWIVFSLVAIGIFMSTLDGSIVNIAMPTIMNDLNAPLSVIEWVALIYLLTVTSLLLSFGRLSDIKGRRIVYTSGLLIFSTGSLFCALAVNANWLIFSRAIQGLGAAMVMSCSPAIIADTFSEKNRGKALGMIGAVVASGLTVGPAVGGFLLHSFSWRAIFFINIPIGLFAAITTFILLKGSKTDLKRKESFDYKGAILIGCSLIAFLFVMTNFHSWGLLSFKTISISLFSIASFSLLIMVEKKSQYPIINISLFKIRLFTLPLLSAVTIFITLFIVIFLMPFYLTLPCGFSTAKAGFFLVIPFFFMFISPITGAVADKTGSRFLCTTGMSIVLIALFSLSRLTPDSSTFSIAMRMALIGIGTAFFGPPNNVTILNGVPPRYRGVTGGIIATARNLGMVLGIGVAGTVFTYYFSTLSNGMSLENYTPELEPFFMHAFKYAMVTGAIIAGIGIILSFLRGNDSKKITI